jgi:DNA-binding response OmpR family regulator
LRALLLQDQASVVRNLRPFLEDEGFEVVVAHDAAGGDALARAAPFDAVLLDMLLPGGCPLALLERWRRHALAMPVLALAAGNSVDETVRCLDAGADDCVTRPFPFRELLARLRALVRRGRAARGPVLHTFDLEVDTATRIVRRAGKVIRLTPREYGLLELLAQHRGRVVTRTMIWEHLYDEQDESTSNVVDVYVRYLRNKIDKGFDPPLILTRWGQGYLLRADAPGA